jgi:ABC-type Na+ efflux pump permease subunit
MEILKDLQPSTLIIIIVILLLAISGLLKLTLYFAKSASEKIVKSIKLDMQTVLEKLDTNSNRLILIGINFDAMHQTIGDLFNGEYRDGFEKRKKELMENAIFLRRQSNSE